MPPKRKVQDESPIDRKAREALMLATKTLKKKGSLVNLFGYDKKVDRKELEAIFRIYDKDGDGHITSDELAGIFRGFGKRPMTHRIQLMLDEIDTDQNGTIELEEWVSYMERQAANEAKDVTEREYVPEAIMGSRINGSGDRELFIKWLGYPEEVNTWEPAANFEQQDLEAYDESAKDKKEDDGEDDDGSKKKKQKTKKAPAKKAKPAKKRGKKAAADDGDDDEKVDDSVSSSSSSSSFAAPSLKKNASIIAFYNANAALQHIDGASVDKHDNPEGKENDLGVDGAFENFTVAVGLFGSVPNFNDTVGKALASKGFAVSVHTDEKEFAKVVTDCDLAWIVSGQEFDESKVSKHNFATAVEAHYKAGGGLLVWADAMNHGHASMLTDLIFGGKLANSGESSAGVTLAAADAGAGAPAASQFKSHLITTGLTHLVQGDGCAQFVGDVVPASLDVLAMTPASHPLILFSKPVALGSSQGRAVIDMGASKLTGHWDGAGTDRYVKNASVWLLGLDHRIASDLPLRGKKKKDASLKKWVWQYQHGSRWHNYDTDASNVVEGIYQDYLKNPMVDVRSVKSGEWHYMVDFTNMLQQNIEHHNRTKRNIRRVFEDKSAEGTA